MHSGRATQAGQSQPARLKKANPPSQSPPPDAVDPPIEQLTSRHALQPDLEEQQQVLPAGPEHQAAGTQKKKKSKPPERKRNHSHSQRSTAQDGANANNQQAGAGSPGSPEGEQSGQVQAQENQPQEQEERGSR